MIVQVRGEDEALEVDEEGKDNDNAEEKDDDVKDDDGMPDDLNLDNAQEVCTKYYFFVNSALSGYILMFLSNNESWHMAMVRVVFFSSVVFTIGVRCWSVCALYAIPVPIGGESTIDPRACPQVETREINSAET